MAAGEVRAFEDAAALARGSAREILRRADASLAARGAFHLALAGGSTPRATYSELAGLDADLSRWHVWFGDERCVPPEHGDSNYRMAAEAWLDRAPRPPGHVHRIRTESGDPARAARAYERELLEHLGEPPRLDLVLLGLGADGHTASLFPGSPALREDAALVVPARASAPPFERVTLTARALSLAREVLVLVSGSTKAPALAAALAGSALPAELPVLLVRPATPIRWHADRAALALVPPELVQRG